MGNRFKKILILVFVIFVSIFYFKQLRVYQIKHISVFGNIATQEQDVIDAVKSKFMYKLNVAVLSKQIKKMPWVKNCIVKKVWPDRVIIFIEEHIPIFKKDEIYITSDGLALGTHYPINRIHYLGDFNEYEASDLLYILLKHSNILDTTWAVHRVRQNRWDVILDSGLRIKCGDHKLEKSLMRYLTLPPQIPKTNIVDFRHPQRTVFYNEN